MLGLRISWVRVRPLSSPAREVTKQKPRAGNQSVLKRRVDGKRQQWIAKGAIKEKHVAE
jgi:hypothetical protein